MKSGVTVDAQSFHPAGAEPAPSLVDRWSGSLVMIRKKKAQEALSYRPMKDVMVAHLQTFSTLAFGPRRVVCFYRFRNVVETT